MVQRLQNVELCNICCSDPVTVKLWVSAGCDVGGDRADYEDS